MNAYNPYAASPSWDELERARRVGMIPTYDRPSIGTVPPEVTRELLRRKLAGKVGLGGVMDKRDALRESVSTGLGNALESGVGAAAGALKAAGSGLAKGAGSGAAKALGAL